MLTAVVIRSRILTTARFFGEPQWSFLENSCEELFRHRTMRPDILELFVVLFGQNKKSYVQTHVVVLELEGADHLARVENEILEGIRHNLWRRRGPRGLQKHAMLGEDLGTKISRESLLVSPQTTLLGPTPEHRTTTTNSFFPGFRLSFCHPRVELNFEILREPPPVWNDHDQQFFPRISAVLLRSARGTDFGNFAGAPSPANDWRGLPSPANQLC